MYSMNAHIFLLNEFFSFNKNRNEEKNGKAKTVFTYLRSALSLYVQSVQLDENDEWR